MEDPISLDFDVDEMMSRKLAETVFNSVANSVDCKNHQQIMNQISIELAKYEKYFDKKNIDMAHKFVEFRFNTINPITYIEADTKNPSATALEILKADTTFYHVIYAWEDNDQEEPVHHGYFWFRNSIEFSEFCAQLYKKDVGIVEAVHRIVDLK